MSLQAYSIIFRGKLDEKKWNQFIKILRTEKIRYECRKMPDAAIVLFWTELSYVHDDPSKKKVPWAEMQIIKNKIK